MDEKTLKQMILVVDDAPINIEILTGILKDDYNVRFAKNGATALKLAEKFLPDIILLDVVMPEMNGFEVCKKLKEKPLTENIPVIFVTANNQANDEAKGFELGAVDYISKPVSPVIVKARVKTQLALHDQNRELSRQVYEKTKEINHTHLETINMLGHASEYKDNETGQHISRMSKYSYIISKEYGLSENEALLLLNSAPMHDLGKIGIPDSILQKPGKLTGEEYKVMQEHCIIGKNILDAQKSKLFVIASIVAYEHHEKWNGKGYPRGIKGEEISIYGRITAIADVFDALTSKRPYKDAWETERAINLIKEEAGEHFDPDLVNSFVNVIPEILREKDSINNNLN